MSESKAEHCCACSKSEDRVNVLTLAVSVIGDSSASRELKIIAEDLLEAAFKSAQAHYTVRGLPPL